MKNRKREICTSGTARDEDGNILIYSANLFGSAVDVVWRSLVAMAGEIFSGLPLVGYERGYELAAAHRAGFETVGLLRVWTLPARA
jgi:hypothetical protein